MKTLEIDRDWRSFWREIGSRIPSDRPMEQIGWTICGQPVDPEQVDLICHAVSSYLSLSPLDVVVDLCCGNGLLTEKLTARCRQVIGVDYSESLIASARSRSSAQNVTYVVSDVTAMPPDLLPISASKLCMAGSLQYLGPKSLGTMLERLAALLPGQAVIAFINVPDASKVELFADTPERRLKFEEHRAAGSDRMGTWWDRDELAALLRAHGYDPVFKAPAPERLSAHYRFDLVATRQGEMT